MSDGQPLSAAPRHLRLLADWFDAHYPDDPNPQAQQDLRHWANLIGRVVDAVVDQAIRDAAQPPNPTSPQ